MSAGREETTQPFFGGGVLAGTTWVCARCRDVYQAGHICGPERYEWNVERNAAHRCSCDTCYAAFKAGRNA